MDAEYKKHVFLIKHIGEYQPHDGYHIWHPATDLFETESQFIVKIEIAGMQNEDFSINFDKGLLSISGSRTSNEEAGCFHRMEIPYGEFATTIQITGDIQIDSIGASYENGFLTIMLPKKASVRVKINDEQDK